MATRAGERKTQILEHLALMLEQPHVARITTAALAARMHVSEAALYRHFASKAQMFEGLIDSIDLTLNTLAQDVTQRAPDGLTRARELVHGLLVFAEHHRGLSRVLTGEALVTEDNRLQTRVNEQLDQIRQALHQMLRDGVIDGSLPAGADTTALAHVILHVVLGKWLMFAHSGWRDLPTADFAAQLAWLLPRP